ncbi:MAG: hypothetical protein BMS9Abin14_298 [Gammaproteobacteria bacterium]|nr:MAG: hypothetical protein BMS9Abin14_298 [Gammaproteobacteria bacterium]
MSRAARNANSRGHKNYATWSVVQWLADDESRYLAARELAAANPTSQQVAEFVFERMPRGTPGMDGPEDYLTVDWEAVRVAICQE